MRRLCGHSSDNGTQAGAEMKPAIFNARFYLLLLLIGLAEFVVHEFAHWLTGITLGYDMVATPNRVYSLSPTTPIHAMLISAAGPLITIAVGVVGYLMVRSRSSWLGFAMVYTAFFSRLLAMGVSAFNPNDEARISRDLGIGMWTLPAIVVLSLLVLTYLSSRHLKLGFKDHFLCYLVASITVSLVVGADHFFFRG
jgi:hypothetical protein